MQIQKKISERTTKISIRQKMFWAICSMILLLTIIVCSIVFVVFKREMESQIYRMGCQTLQESAVNISRTILGREENLTYKIEECGLFEDKIYKEYSENSKEMKQLVAFVENAGFHVTSCYLVRAEGSEEFWSNGNSSIGDFRKSQINDVMQEESATLQRNRGTVLWRRVEDAPESVYFIKSVVDGGTLENQGILCIQIDNHFFETLQNSGNLLLLHDEHGNLLYYAEELKPALPQILEGRSDDYLIMQTKITKKNWKMTGLVSRQQIIDTLSHLLVLLVTIGGIFCIISFLIAKYISENMTANITSLIAGMRQLEQGKQADMVQAKSADETFYLVESFNHMNQRLQETVEQLAVNRTQKERAEYNALIAQLNPHFLYNSLESISAMAKLGGQREIVEAVDNLAKLLRACLSGNDAEISLEKEFDYIRQYLSLERLMTGGWIDWDIDCEEKLYACRVPKLILQPLVENSIIHGFDGPSQEGMIVIMVKVDRGRLMIEVSDNGTGMPQQYADEILAGQEVRKHVQDRKHIGIRSIQQRIHYLYGEHYGIQIHTAEGAGTTVRLMLPMIKE